MGSRGKNVTPSRVFLGTPGQVQLMPWTGTNADFNIAVSGDSLRGDKGGQHSIRRHLHDRRQPDGEPRRPNDANEAEALVAHTFHSSVALKKRRDDK